MCGLFPVAAEEAAGTHRELDGTVAVAVAVRVALRLSPHKRWVLLNIR